MKALNEKEVLWAHLKFALYLVALIIMVQLFVFSYLRTAEAEISEIKKKTGDNEMIFREQSELCDSYAEIFKLYRSFDVSESANSEFLMQSIVTRKKEITSKIEQLPESDVVMHKFILSKMDEFLRVRDSISVLKKEEQKVKHDFIMCSGDYQKAKVKLKRGVLTAN